MNRIMKWGRRAVAAVLGTAAIGMGLIVPSAAAAPDPGVALCCSKTANNSQFVVTTRKNWTCSWGTTGSSSTGCVGGATHIISPGGASPLFEDWDVLQIDAGWCYKVQFVVPGKVWTLFFNRSGLGNLYVKIEDWGTAIVQAQRFGSCP